MEVEIRARSASRLLIRPCISAISFLAQAGTSEFEGLELGVVTSV